VGTFTGRLLPEKRGGVEKERGYNSRGGRGESGGVILSLSWEEKKRRATAMPRKKGGLSILKKN